MTAFLAGAATVSGGGDAQGKAVVEQYNKLRQDWLVWDTLYQEVATFFMPDYKDTFHTKGQTPSPARRTNKELFTSEGIRAADRLAAIMESLITPRGQRWHGLQHLSKDLINDIEVQEWFDAATDALFKYRYLPEANYVSQQYDTYRSLVTFGTGAMFIDKNETGGFRYASIHVSQLVFDVNHQGAVDTVFRGPIRMSARNIVAKFNEDDDVVPDEIQKAAKDNENKQFDLIHYVAPNLNMKRGREGKEGMPYKGCYVELSSGTTLRNEGFRTFPYVVSRFTTAPGEIQGRSPAMTALPNVKTLNSMAKTHLKIGHRHSDPIMLAHDDGLLDIVGMRPGQIIPGALTSEGRQLLMPLQAGNFDINANIMELQIREIQAAFMLDVFQLMAQGGEMTATEVIERSREKAAFLTPVFGRQETEGTGVQIPRELQLLLDQGLLPPIPEKIAEEGLKFSIVYDSPLSRSQKAEQFAGVMRSIEVAANFATLLQDPSIMDPFNMDVIVPEFALQQATPARMLNKPEEIEKIRAERAQMQEAQMAIQAAPAAAAIMSKQQGAPA